MASYDYYARPSRHRDSHSNRPREDSSRYQSSSSSHNYYAPHSSSKDAHPSRSRSTRHRSNTHRRQKWPPDPFAEDETDSIARESRASSLRDRSDGAVPHRGAVDQEPIILDVEHRYEDNSEHRFTHVHDPLYTPDLSSDELVRNKRKEEFKNRRKEDHSSRGKPKVPTLNTDFEADEPSLLSRRPPSPYSYTKPTVAGDEPSFSSKETSGNSFLSPAPLTPSRHGPGAGKLDHNSNASNASTAHSLKPNKNRNGQAVFDASSDEDLDELKGLSLKKKPARYSFVATDFAKEDLRTSLNEQANTTSRVPSPIPAHLLPKLADPKPKDEPLARKVASTTDSVDRPSHLKSDSRQSSFSRSANQQPLQRASSGRAPSSHPPSPPRSPRLTRVESLTSEARPSSSASIRPSSPLTNAPAPTVIPTPPRTSDGPASWGTSHPLVPPASYPQVPSTSYPQQHYDYQTQATTTAVPPPIDVYQSYPYEQTYGYQATASAVPPLTNAYPNYPSECQHSYNSTASAIPPQPTVYPNHSFEPQYGYRPTATVVPPQPGVYQTYSSRTTHLPYPEDHDFGIAHTMPSVDAYRPRVTESPPIPPSRTSSSSSIRPQQIHRPSMGGSRPIEPPSLPPRPKTNYDGHQPRSTFESAYARDLPNCQRRSYSASFDDWYALKGYRSFAICPNCFESLFEGTAFESCFEYRMKMSRDTEVKCDFGAPWARIAWLLTTRRRLRDLSLLECLAKIAETEEECPGNGTWYGLADRHGEFIRNFYVCEYDMHQIISLMPRFKGIFTVQERNNRRSHRCTFYTNGPNFRHYLDELTNIHETFDPRRDIELDMQPFISQFKATLDSTRSPTLPRRSPCQRDIMLRDEFWHLIPEFPQLTVCGECFDAHIRPLIGSGSRLAKKFLLKPKHLGDEKWGTSCQLYSSRSQQAWQYAVQSEDFDYLFRYFSNRYLREQESQAKHRTLKQHLDAMSPYGPSPPWPYAYPGTKPPARDISSEIQHLEDEWRSIE